VENGTAQIVLLCLAATAEEREAVRQICQLVAELPLGIELAAAWVATLACREIAGELQRTMHFLASTARDVTDRHRSIRAAFDHSWALLSAAVTGETTRKPGGFTNHARSWDAPSAFASLQVQHRRAGLR
jgi:predicted ATPase